LFKDLPADVRYSVPLDTQFRYQVYETTIPVRNAMVSQFY
jgi:type IV pilus assembly protein PilW